MNKNKKRFWKFFLLVVLYMFAMTLLVDCIWNLTAKDPVSTLFTTSALLHRAFDAIIAGLLISLLFVLVKKKNPD